MKGWLLVLLSLCLVLASANLLSKLQEQREQCTYMQSTRPRTFSFVDPGALASNLLQSGSKLRYEELHFKYQKTRVNNPHQCKNFDISDPGRANRAKLSVAVGLGSVDEMVSGPHERDIKRRIPRGFQLASREAWEALGAHFHFPKTVEELADWKDPVRFEVLATFDEPTSSGTATTAKTAKPALLRGLESKLKSLPGTLQQKIDRFMNSYVMTELLQRFSMRDHDEQQRPFYVRYKHLEIRSVSNLLDVLEVLGHRIKAQARTEHASGEYKTMATQEFLEAVGFSGSRSIRPAAYKEFVDVPYVENMDVKELLQRQIPEREAEIRHSSGTFKMPTLHGEIMIEVEFDPSAFPDTKHGSRKVTDELPSEDVKIDFSFTAEVHQDPNIAQFYANDRFIRPKWFGCKRHYKSGGLGRHIDVRLENFEAKRMITLASEYVYTINQVGSHYLQGGYFITGVCMDFAIVVQNAMLKGFLGMKEDDISPMMYPIMNHIPTLRKLQENVWLRKQQPLDSRDRIPPALAEALLVGLNTHDTDLMVSGHHIPKAPFPERALRSIPFPIQEMPFDMHRDTILRLKQIVQTTRGYEEVATEVQNLPWFGAFCRENEFGYLEDIWENVLGSEETKSDRLLVDMFSPSPLVKTSTRSEASFGLEDLLDGGVSSVGVSSDGGSKASEPRTGHVDPIVPPSDKMTSSTESVVEPKLRIFIPDTSVGEEDLPIEPFAEPPAPRHKLTRSTKRVRRAPHVVEPALPIPHSSTPRTSAGHEDSSAESVEEHLAPRPRLLITNEVSDPEDSPPSPKLHLSIPRTPVSHDHLRVPFAPRHSISDHVTGSTKSVPVVNPLSARLPISMPSDDEDGSAFQSDDEAGDDATPGGRYDYTHESASRLSYSEYQVEYLLGGVQINVRAKRQLAHYLLAEVVKEARIKMREVLTSVDLETLSDRLFQAHYGGLEAESFLQIAERIDKVDGIVTLPSPEFSVETLFTSIKERVLNSDDHPLTRMEPSLKHKSILKYIFPHIEDTDVALHELFMPILKRGTKMFKTFLPSFLQSEVVNRVILRCLDASHLATLPLPTVDDRLASNTIVPGIRFDPSVVKAERKETRKRSLTSRKALPVWHMHRDYLEPSLENRRVEILA